MSERTDPLKFWENILSPKTPREMAALRKDCRDAAVLLAEAVKGCEIVDTEHAEPKRMAEELVQISKSLGIDAVKKQIAAWQENTTDADMKQMLRVFTRLLHKEASNA